MRIHKGDRVVVRTGKYKGHTSEVVRALPSEGKIVLDGVNVAKRHSKPNARTYQAGIIDKFMPLQVSNVSIVC
ncbi:MAG: 50S ribosomal protein L24, partial [Acidimicrobiales bacterium]